MGRWEVFGLVILTEMKAPGRKMIPIIAMVVCFLVSRIISKSFCARCVSLLSSSFEISKLSVRCLVNFSNLISFCCRNMLSETRFRRTFPTSFSRESVMWRCVRIPSSLTFSSLTLEASSGSTASLRFFWLSGHLVLRSASVFSMVWSMPRYPSGRFQSTSL